jgi:mRNA interferase MazF
MGLIERGEIYWIQFDPIMGSEIGKVRPALVISNNHNNELADTITVLPITSRKGKVYPFEVFLPKGIGGLTSDSKAKANQIRTVDKKRVKGFLGNIPEDILNEAESAMKIHLGLE